MNKRVLARMVREIQQADYHVFVWKNGEQMPPALNAMVEVEAVAMYKKFEDERREREKELSKNAVNANQTEWDNTCMAAPESITESLANRITAVLNYVDYRVIPGVIRLARRILTERIKSELAHYTQREQEIAQESRNCATRIIDYTNVINDLEAQESTTASEF